jgi:diguanylate cyclase (GGDEF)-like protein/PAS domain S-box-containing protein
VTVHRPTVSRATTRRRPPWRVLALLVVGVAVIAGMIVLADRSRTQADQARQAQVVLEHLHATAERVDALTWRNIKSGRTRGVPADALSQGFDAYRAIGADLRALKRLGVPPSRYAPLEDTLGRIYAAGMQALQEAGVDTKAGRTLVQRRFSPLVDRINAQISAAIDQQDAEVRSAQRRTTIGWLGSLAGGLLLLALVAWRLAIIQRSSAAAEQARAIERRSEERLRTLVRHSSDAVTVIDPDSTVRWIAESVHRVLGYEPSDLVGRPLADLVHPDDLAHARELLAGAVVRAGRAGTATLRLRAASGEHRHIELLAENLLGVPEIDGVLLSLRDISDRRDLEERLRHQAFHDDLTGLPNRALFDDRLTQALARARRTGGRTAVIFIDLDDFKSVNDSLGHAVGDELLRATSERLVTTMRAQDTAARLGGDEFAVLAEGVADEAEALLLAERLRQVLIVPLTIGGHRLTPSASIGVACPDGGLGADEALGNADVAMYAAKAAGKGRVATFEPVMRERVVERVRLTAELDRALEDGELFLEYQPIVNLDAAAIEGVEALVRWNHPTRGRLGPDAFIGVAESSGHIVAIGLWVLEEACRQLAAWDAEHPAARALEMNVNVSTRQLADPDLPGQLQAIVDATGVAPERLTLEITEHLLLDDSGHVQRQLRLLKDIGVRLAVDDFGTGYSALSYLQAFPIDALKIDRSFVMGMDQDAEKAQLVRGIIEIGHSLNLRVVTEGIEEHDQAVLARDFRSGYGQGYLFSRPVAAADLTRLLDDPLPLDPQEVSS